jgi:predicted  nucleic acid-binding Zn-ribbon protein
MEQILELLKAMQEKMDANLREIKEDIKTNRAKMDTNQERLEAEMNAIREKMETNQDKTDTNNEKFEVLQDTLVSWMDAHPIYSHP